MEEWMVQTTVSVSDPSLVHPSGCRSVCAWETVLVWYSDSTMDSASERMTEHKLEIVMVILLAIASENQTDFVLEPTLDSTTESALENLLEKPREIVLAILSVSMWETAMDSSSDYAMDCVSD